MNEDLSPSAKQIAELISKLTYEEIVHFVAVFGLEKEKLEQAKKRDAEEQIRVIAAKAGLTVTIDNAERFEKRKTGAKKGSKSKVKYRNNETGQEWSGRGLKPKWILDLLAQKKDLKDYLTDDFKVNTSNTNDPATTTIANDNKQ
jgi:DNA-binding protein H-NS